jgi:hypothetical protein
VVTCAVRSAISSSPVPVRFPVPYCHCPCWKFKGNLFSAVHAATLRPRNPAVPSKYSMAFRSFYQVQIVYIYWKRSSVSNTSVSVDGCL